MIWSVLWYRQGKELNIAQFDKIFAGVYFEGAGTEKIQRNYRSAAIQRRLELLSSPVALVSAALKNATYTRLLDTACALFARKGYNATTIREIADAMKVRKASLYYYISGKDDLIYEISKAALEHLTAGVQWVIEDAEGPADRLYAFIIAHVVSLLQHQNWHATSNEELVTYTAERRNAIVALRDKYELLGRTLLQEAQEAGVIRSDIPVKYLSLLLFGMITNIYPWYRPTVDVAPTELGFMLADLFLTGIAPQWPAAIS
jgi:TetR/AcrR family transcriptional regulator, cholesterol catabolism regulator